MARALATDPELLLLDELMAGLTHTEIAEAMRDIAQIRSRGITVIMIEHVMQAIMSICDRIVVLDYGRKIAEGTPAEVASEREGHRSLSWGRNAMLEVDGLSAGYGRVQVLWDLSPEGRGRGVRRPDRCERRREDDPAEDDHGRDETVGRHRSRSWARGSTTMHRQRHRRPGTVAHPREPQAVHRHVHQGEPGDGRLSQALLEGTAGRR